MAVVISRLSLEIFTKYSAVKTELEMEEENLWGLFSVHNKRGLGLVASGVAGWVGKLKIFEKKKKCVIIGPGVGRTFFILCETGMSFLGGRGGATL